MQRKVRGQRGCGCRGSDILTGLPGGPGAPLGPISPRGPCKEVGASSPHHRAEAP